jgi:hypothetical protein
MFIGRHSSSFDPTPDPSDFVLLYWYGKFVRKSKNMLCNINLCKCKILQMDSCSNKFEKGTCCESRNQIKFFIVAIVVLNV